MAEVKRTYYSSGKLESECFEINGKMYGEYKSYYENGQLCIMCTYLNGELVESYNYENGEKNENKTT